MVRGFVRRAKAEVPVRPTVCFRCLAGETETERHGKYRVELYRFVQAGAGDQMSLFGIDCIVCIYLDSSNVELVPL